ncbi:MAG TPA: thioredoxin family protein [Pirellulales bacterium]|nr:thioredoxin family protein [Pirellulales bacterium]
MRGLLLGAALACTTTVVGKEPQPVAKPTETLHSITGRVVDKADRPVPGVKVESVNKWEHAVASTDGDGRFVLQLPRRPRDLLLVRATDPDGAQQAFAGFAVGDDYKTMLWRFLPNGKIGLPEELRLVLRPAKKIEVIVVDCEKQPVADAHVFLMATWYVKLAEAQTDGEGKALLVIPADAARYAIVAMKPKVGFDYWLYQSPTAENESRYRLPRDKEEPLTFVLNGARHVVLKLVDEDGRPVLGGKASPRMIEKPRKGSGHQAFNVYDTGVLYTSGVADFSATSNARGEAVFDYFPTDGLGSIGLHAMAAGYSVTDDPAWLEPGSGDAEATATLARQILLEAQVTYNDGRPAPGTLVSLHHDALEDGRPTPAPPSASYTTLTDDQGVARLHVFANDFQLIRAWRDRWAAPLVTNITRDEPPKGPLRIVLQPATRLHGVLRTREGRLLLPNQSMTVQRHLEEQYRRLRDAGLTLKPKARGALPNVDLWLMPEHTATTDDRGEFEFFLGPGKYQLRYGEEPPMEVELDGQAELQVDFTAERANRVEFAGRAVYEGREREGVAGATVIAYHHSEKRLAPHTETVANAKGAFHFTRPPLAMLLYARDEEGRFSGSTRVAADDDSIILRLQPAASVHGRLIDATSGEPLRSVRVVYGVQWEGPSTLQVCGGSVQTDERGEFAGAGLLPGQQYQFTLYRSNSLLTLTPREAGDIDLGTYRVDLTGKAGLDATGPVAAPDSPDIYDTDIDGEELVAAALKRAKTEQKRVLLVFGANWSASCHRLSDCFEANEAISTRLQEGYVVALIDVDNSAKTGRNAKLSRRYRQINARLPVLVMLDADGREIAVDVSQNLEDADHYNPEKVLALLNQNVAANRAFPAGLRGGRRVREPRSQTP